MRKNIGTTSSTASDSIHRQCGGREHRIGKALAQRRNSLHIKVALRRSCLEVDLKKFSREILVQRGKRFGEVARLSITYDWRLMAIDLDMRDRHQASPFWRTQRIMARREEYALPAQGKSGGQIGHRGVP